MEKILKFINTYVPNIGAPNFIRQTLLNIKGQIGPDTISVGDFNTHFSSMHRSPRPKPKHNNTDISEVNHTTD
jgi:hypothetical protein